MKTVKNFHVYIEQSMKHDLISVTKQRSLWEFLDKPKIEIMFHVFSVSHSCWSRFWNSSKFRTFIEGESSEFSQGPGSKTFIEEEARDFPKYQGLYIEGKLGIFSSSRAFKEGRGTEFFQVPGPLYRETVISLF